MVSMEAMATLAGKLKEGKMKRSAGSPTVVAVRSFFSYVWFKLLG